MMNHSFGLAVALHARGPSLRLKGIQAVCYTSSLFCYCLTAPQILLHQGFHCHSRPLHLPSHCQGPPHLSRSYFLTCPRPVLCRCPPPRPVLCRCLPPRPVLCRCPLPHPVLCRYPPPRPVLCLCPHCQVLCDLCVLHGPWILLRCCRPIPPMAGSHSRLHAYQTFPLRPVVQHRICRCCSSSSSQDTGCQCDQPRHLGIA